MSDEDIAQPKKKRRWWRCLAALGIILLLIIVTPIIGIEGFCGAPSAPALAPAAVTPPLPAITEKGYRRPEANTYFTFPEWYIVYSFEDFGRFLDKSSESAFPYVTHIAGFWTSFCTINRTVPKGPVSLFETKLMIYVIGISFTVEYAVKGLYENTVGRLFEWWRGPNPTPEDIYARAVLQDYADFLYTIPWYKFPFMEKLRGLWSATPLGGPSTVRRWERKFSLSTEYLLKAGYAWVIQKGLDATSDDEAREIMLVVRTLPPEALAKEPRIKVLRALDAERQLILVPRYKAFTEIALGLARDNRPIVEIAGNRNMLITVILPDGPSPQVEGLRELFSVPLGAQPGFRRAGFDIKVGDLPRVVKALEGSGATVEHLYDY